MDLCLYYINYFGIAWFFLLEGFSLGSLRSGHPDLTGSAKPGLSSTLSLARVRTLARVPPRTLARGPDRAPPGGVPGKAALEKRG